MPSFSDVYVFLFSFEVPFRFLWKPWLSMQSWKPYIQVKKTVTHCTNEHEQYPLKKLTFEFRKTG